MDIDAARQDQAALVAAHEASRRMALAPGVMLLWESQTTIDHEQAEMMWGEEDAETRAAMRAGYGALRPCEALLTATLTIEGHDEGTARTSLYAGVETRLRLVSGRVEITARPVGPTSSAEAAPDVLRLAFDIPVGFDVGEAGLVIDHPRLQIQAPLPGAVRRSPLG